MREIAVWVVPYNFRMQKVPTHIYFLPPLVVKQQTIIPGVFFALNRFDLLSSPTVEKVMICSLKNQLLFIVGKDFKKYLEEKYKSVHESNYFFNCSAALIQLCFWPDLFWEK